jgi:hypothetical protein
MDGEVRWQDLIQQALDYDIESSTIEEIESGIESGDFQLWREGDSAVVTAGFHLQFGGVGVRVVAAAGNLQEITKILAEVEREARANGVEALTAVGRRGWVGIAQEAGWGHAASVYVKRLT